MRILICDSNPPHSLGCSFERALRRLGHDANLFDETPRVGSAGERRWRRALRRGVRPVLELALNLSLLAQVSRMRPDLLLVVKGHAYMPGTIRRLRRLLPRLAVYHPDDLHNPLNTSRRMLAALPLFDVVFTPRRFALQELRAEGARRVEWIPFAFDPGQHFPPEESATPPAPIRSSIAFVGTWAAERERWLEAVAARWPLAVWGNGWERLPSTSPLRRSIRGREIQSADLRTVFGAAAINLGLLRRSNRDRHQMRSFEIPACRGFMLTERTEDHLGFFEEGREAVFYEGERELLAAIDRYIEDEPARRSIAAAARRRVCSGGYSYVDRCASMLSALGQLS